MSRSTTVTAHQSGPAANESESVNDEVSTRPKRRREALADGGHVRHIGYPVPVSPGQLGQQGSKPLVKPPQILDKRRQRIDGVPSLNTGYCVGLPTTVFP